MVGLFGAMGAHLAGPLIGAAGALLAAVGIYFLGHRAGKSAATSAAAKQVQATETVVIARQTAMSQAQADAPCDEDAEIRILKEGLL